MKNEMITNTLKDLNYNFNEKYSFQDIEYIKLKNNRVINPSWSNTRFSYNKKKLHIYYGESVPYGSKLVNNYFITGSYNCLIFRDSILPSESEYHSLFRKPKEGDMLIQYSNGVILKETIIVKIQREGIIIRMYLQDDLEYNGGYFELSFYDYTKYNVKSDHSNHVIGVYTNFECSDKPSEIIKLKHIKEIKLKTGVLIRD